MSGVEIAVPVIAAVFALVSAFKDGGTIAEKLKERRQRKGAQPPTERLQRVFQQGVQDIENSKTEGVEDFGNEFVQDQVTASKLKDITIVLQDSIIKELTAAFHNDDMNDFSPAIDSIIQVRKEAVNVLNEHYLSLQRRRSQRHSMIQQHTQSTDTAQQTSPRPIPLHTRTETRDSTTSETPSSGRTEIHYARRSGSLASTGDFDTGLQSPESPQPKSRTGKWGGLFNRHPSNDASNFPTQRQQSQSQSHPPSQQLTPQPPQLQSPPLSDVIPPNERQPRAAGGANTWSLPSPALRRASTAHSTLEPFNSIRDAIVISEDNNYAGLCKCAYHAQKMRLGKAMETSVRNFERMYHCKKCKFRLMADPTQRGNPHFDDRIQTSVSSMKFRCLFLWKSHIPNKDVKLRQYACLLCLLTGRQSNTYAGEDDLLWHISRHANEAVVESTVRSGASARTNTILLQGKIEIYPDGVLLADDGGLDIEFPPDLKPKDQERPISTAISTSFPMLPESAIENIENTSRPMMLSRASSGIQTPNRQNYSHTPHRQSQSHSPRPHTHTHTHILNHSPTMVDTNTTYMLPPPMTQAHEIHGESIMVGDSNSYSNSMYSRSPRHSPGQTAPESLRDLPTGSPYENAWRQEPTRTRYAELEAPPSYPHNHWPLQ